MTGNLAALFIVIGLICLAIGAILLLVERDES